MGRQRIRQPSRQHGKWRWRWAAFGALALIAASAGAFWRISDSSDASSGRPRLAVDRTDVDLGYRRYGVPARVVFTVSNAGDGVLRLRDAPRVIAKAGC